MTFKDIRELFENCEVTKTLTGPAEWHEDKQRYTIFSSKQFAWEIFKEAYYLGTIHGRD